MFISDLNVKQEFKLEDLETDRKFKDANDSVPEFMLKKRSKDQNQELETKLEESHPATVDSLIYTQNAASHQDSLLDLKMKIK